MSILHHTPHSWTFIRHTRLILCVPLVGGWQEKQGKVGDPGSQKAMELERDLTTLQAKLTTAEGRVFMT